MLSYQNVWHNLNEIYLPAQQRHLTTRGAASCSLWGPKGIISGGIEGALPFFFFFGTRPYVCVRACV